jgi:hypothetical protein
MLLSARSVAQLATVALVRPIGVTRIVALAVVNPIEL